MDKRMRAYLSLIRVKQYSKNLLVFAAAIFAGNMFNDDIIIKAICTFVAFSFTASAVYIINDIADVDKDRQHPHKCNRPIAAGKISIKEAVILAVLLLLLAIAFACLINNDLLIVLAAYLVMNLAYSAKLKHLVIFDVMIIALGFVLRAVAGVVAAGVVASDWFLLCVFMLSLFLALAKRRAEMVLFVQEKEKRRVVLQEYSLDLLDQLLGIATAMAIMSYSLFALQTKDGLDDWVGIKLMLFTVPLVVYGMFRYLYLVHIKKQGGTPEDVLINDKHILGSCIVFFYIVVLIRCF